jgi:hypothetical protein
MGAVTPDDVRALAMALPEVTERPHHNRTSFRVAGKIFATMPPDGDSVNIMLGEEDARAAAEASGGVDLLWWGRRLAGVRVVLGPADPTVVAELLADAWHRRAPREVAAGHEVGRGRSEAGGGRSDADR